MAEPGDFLRRWSRLKRAARPPAKPAAATAQAPLPTAATPAPAPSEEPEAPALPAIESLTKDSDYTPFFRPDVPQALRNEALQKLYRSDPVFANLDGLVEYGEDFGEAFRIPGVVATVYRVLQGMPGGEAEEAAEAQPAAADGDSAAEAEPRRVEQEEAKAGTASAGKKSGSDASPVAIDGAIKLV